MPTLINGQAADTVAAADRGLNYGDGLFETIAVVDRRPLLWEPHLQRLLHGARALGLPPPDPGLLEAEALQLAATAAPHAVLRIVLTAGSGGRGYARPEQTLCNRILGLHPMPTYPAAHWREGVAVTVCRTRLALQPDLAGIKHCNRLEQVLARREWTAPGYAEGLVCDMKGRLAEGTMSNVFAVRGGELLTPGLLECGVHGVMRDTVMGLAAAAGMRVTLLDAPLQDWLDGDELFLTNCIIGLWPVHRVGDRRYPPGPLTRDLHGRLLEGGFAPPLSAIAGLAVTG